MATVAELRLAGESSRQVFDVLLRTLAEPGTVRRLPDGVVPGVHPACVLALALADVEVGVCVDDDADGELTRLVADATGATAVPTHAAWVVVSTEPTPGLVDRCRRGSALAPEDGARVALAVDALHTGGGEDTVVRLRGPGVPGERVLGIEGLDPAVVDARAAACAAFPAGVDFWLVTADGEVAAISRSTRVEMVRADGGAGLEGAGAGTRGRGGTGEPGRAEQSGPGGAVETGSD